MKKGIFLSVFILISIISFAQVQRIVKPVDSSSVSKTTTGINSPGTQRKKMMGDLDLTKEQKGKLKEIHQAGKAKKEQIEADDKLSDTEKQSRLRELQKEQAQNTLKILNPEQREKMKAARMQMRKQEKNDLN
jgi:Spy/CpxP family protein refolding chaperone